MANPREQEEIDATLDAALDELDEEDGVESLEIKVKEETTAKTASDTKKTTNGSSGVNREARKESKPAPVMGPVPPPPSISDDDDPEKLLASMMQDLLRAEQQCGDVSDDFLDSFMHEMHTQIKTELQKDMDSSSTKAKKSESKAEKEQKPASVEGKEVDQAISNLVEDMAKQASIDDSGDDAIPNDEQKLLRNLLQGMEGMDGNFDADAMIDDMMQQLVSKELMYEPMKQVVAKFPGWLDEKKDSLSEKEYGDRCKQYECFRKLVNAYEREPNNTSKFMALMQEVQEYGQPPPEIIKEIAPGLELDADGMPKMNEMPFGGGDEECRIM